DLPIEEIIELLFADAVDAQVAAHPEISPIVFQDLKDPVVEKPLSGRAGFDSAVFQPAQPTIVGPNPNHARRVFIDHSHAIADQPLVNGESGELPIADAGQAAIASNP